MPSISDEPATQQMLVSDLLGLAGYLAEAVAEDHVSADAARTELVAEAGEARSLRRAATDAALVYGPESIEASLLRAAASEQAVA